jgi:hypothetical protein
MLVVIELLMGEMRPIFILRISSTSSTVLHLLDTIVSQHFKNRFNASHYLDSRPEPSHDDDLLQIAYSSKAEETVETPSTHLTMAVASSPIWMACGPTHLT